MKKRSIARFNLLLAVIIAASSHAQIANTLSATDKIYGLSRFWQEVNYNFVYLDKITPQVWDSAYRALIPQVVATTNDYDYYRLLQKFCAMLKDGHTEVGMPNIEGVRLQQNIFGEHLIVLSKVDNKVIIKRIFKRDSEKFPLGSEIVSVNGLPVQQYLRDSVAAYISASTDNARLEIATPILLRGLPGSVYTIQIKKPGGQLASFSLKHAKPTDSVMVPAVGYYPDEQRREPIEFRMMNNQIAYLALNTFSVDKHIDTSFERLLPSLEKAKGIIIDLRYNGGGDDGIAFNILQHFIKDSVIKGSSSVVRLLDPYLQATGRYVNVTDTAGDTRKRNAWLLYHGNAVYDQPGTYTSVIDKSIKRITVPVVLLTGSNTESAAEDFVIAADNQPHITRIGEATNGSTGMPYHFDMPGGGWARVCIKKDTYPDGREFVGYGIQPHIKVTPAVNDYLQNKDVVLEAAVNYFRHKK